MKITIYFLVCVFSFASFIKAQNDPNCGTKGPKQFSDHSSRLGIRGGISAQAHEFPWMGMLARYYSDSEGFTVCGASILNSLWVLTSAQCILEKTSHFAFYGGKHNQDQVEPSQFNRSIAKFIPHPNYNSTSKDYDIAVFKLDRELDLSLPQLGSICLPLKQDLDNITGTSCTLTGWGTIDEPDGTVPMFLRKVESTIKPQSECREQIGTTSVTDRMLCWGNEEKGACYGDNGGPLVCQLRDGRWYQYGVMSFFAAAPNPNICYKSVFARTSELFDWIWLTVQNRDNKTVRKCTLDVRGS